MSQVGPRDFYDLLFGGRRATDDDVAALEARVALDPHDLEARALLVASYAFDARALSHALWIIANDPASEAAGAVVCTPVFHHACYDEVVLVWERTLAAFTGTDEQVGRAHLNAAQLAQLARDAERHVRWRERARELLTDERSRMDIARLEIRHLHRNDGQPPAERLARLEEIAQHPRLRKGTLEALAVVSFEANDVTRTERYATELLTLAHADLHALGHWLLGHLALRRGDVEGAIARLMQTVDEDVSPKMLLPRELLEHGQRDAVLRYLEALVLVDDSPWLPGWLDEVRAGRTPDFRGCLWY